MLTPKTEAMIDHGLAALRLAQALPPIGDDPRVPPPGRVSVRLMAEFAGVSPQTIHAIERIALAKMAAGLRTRVPSDVWAEQWECRPSDPAEAPRGTGPWPLGQGAAKARET